MGVVLSASMGGKPIGSFPLGYIYTIFGLEVSLAGPMAGPKPGAC
jgi:hypothetical protein